MTIAAKDSSVDFSSSNHYQDSSISVTALEKEYMEYSLLSFPDYFTKEKDAVTYQNGTGKNRIQVVLTGYTSVNFKE